MIIKNMNNKTKSELQLLKFTRKLLFYFQGK